MSYRHQVSKKSNASTDTLIHKSLHEYPISTQRMKNSNAQFPQHKIKNQQYEQDKFEATKVEIQAKYGTMTPEGQEQLTLLQAKKAAFWQRYLGNTGFYNQDSSQMTARGIDVSPKQAIQTKLTIGAPGDKYEQEAHRVAAQVVTQINAPVSGQSNQNIQREGMPLEDELMMAPQLSSIQREAMLEEEEIQTKPMLQLQAGDSSTTATTELESSIQQARGSGQPLADNIRKPMEQAFGADFSGVKVHTDSQADQLNQSIQAKAFTTGQDVFFRSGEYKPGSRGGQELIAHELTHVVQQSGGVQKQPTNEAEVPFPRYLYHGTSYETGRVIKNSRVLLALSRGGENGRTYICFTDNYNLTNLSSGNKPKDYIFRLNTRNLNRNQWRRVGQNGMNEWRCYVDIPLEQAQFQLRKHKNEADKWKSEP
ncbi:hypothetical protein NIES4071_05400 [Calothrix sp. NIES-4071]|nr:hypothetical protein NIES4071_05400 [Calothrix sp. NIES-4071]BAZ54885.1 hypothetical protein NIES4105_05390 [Calothrix sp. NIES-4105]